MNILVLFAFLIVLIFLISGDSEKVKKIKAIEKEKAQKKIKVDLSIKNAREQVKNNEACIITLRKILESKKQYLNQLKNSDPDKFNEISLNALREWKRDLLHNYITITYRNCDQEREELLKVRETIKTIRKLQVEIKNVEKISSRFFQTIERF